MTSKQSSESTLPPSQPTKPATSSVSDLLTRSEIDELRQTKKRISAYALKAWKEKFDELGIEIGHRS